MNDSGPGRETSETVRTYRGVSLTATGAIKMPRRASTNSANDYLTHNFHPYAAKYPPSVPRELMISLTARGGTILDPFCGCGTTLVEAKLIGRNAIGVDINPLAAFISAAKTTVLSEAECEKATSFLAKLAEGMAHFLRASSSQRTIVPISEAARLPDSQPPDFPNRDHWFQPSVLKELALVHSAISRSSLSLRTKGLLLTAFSAILVSVSNQESETRYAAIDKKIQPGQAFKAFSGKAANMIERMALFRQAASGSMVSAYHADCRDLAFVPDRSIDAVVTSPPYPNTYDYYLYHKLRMMWLGLDWKRAKGNEIGSRLRHSSQGESISSYVEDMSKCFEELDRVLKPDARLAFVIGDSVIRSQRYSGDHLIESIAAPFGMVKTQAWSYGLDEASKVFNPAFRTKGKKEHVVILAKGG